MDDVLKRAPGGYLAFRDDGTICAVNDTVLQLLGAAREDVEGQHVESILTTGAQLFYYTHFFPLLKMQGTAEEIYLSLASSDGDEVPCLLNAQRVDRDGDAPINEIMLLPFSDRGKYEDEILQARRAAEQANRAKDKFLSTVSHELRTPISTIMMMADLLKTERHGPVSDQQKEDLARIRRAADYLHTLIVDILDFARMDTEKVSIDVEPVAVDRLLTRAESLLGPRFEASSLTFDRPPVDDALAVRADPDRVQQILLNLLTNAIKFTDAGGAVKVEVDAGDEAVAIRVRDTGVGIPAEEQTQIFDPFAQGSRAATQSSGDDGIGLGLAISRDLARAMNGDLTVDSTVGEGSTFTLTLPRSRA